MEKKHVNIRKEGREKEEKFEEEEEEEEEEVEVKGSTAAH